MPGGGLYSLILYMHVTDLTKCFRAEYLVCEFPCLLSSVGGYVGIFFGASLFDLILLLEFIVKYLNSISKREN